MSRQTIVILLGLVVLLGLFLRLYDLDEEGLWLDEGGSVIKTEAGLSQFMMGRQPYISPPFYYLLLGNWMKIFGNSESAVRFPSVLFGSLSILMLYQFGKMVFDKTTGLIAAFLIAISTYQIYFSREARMYSLLMLLSLISMYYFINLLSRGVMINLGNTKRIRWVSILIYLLSSILLLYTHNFGISPLIAQNIFALVLFLQTRRIGRLKLKNWVILQLILLLMFLPWIIVIIRQFINLQGNYWSPPVSPRTLLDTLLDYSGSPWLLCLFIFFSFIAWFTPYRNRINQRDPSNPGHGKDGFFPLKPLFLFIWLAVPCLLPFLISILSTPIYISRITLSAAPALYLLAAVGISRLRQTRLKLLSISLIGLLSIPVLWSYYHTSNKEPLREVISQVEAEVKSGDLILILPLWYKKFIFDYYQVRKDIPARGFSSGIISPGDLRELKDLKAEFRRIWIILCQGEDISHLLRDAFPGGFSSSNSWISYYHNFQARKEMAIRVYLLN